MNRDIHWLNFDTSFLSLPFDIRGFLGISRDKDKEKIRAKLITSSEMVFSRNHLSSIMCSADLWTHSLKRFLETELTPLLVLSSDKARCLDCVSPLNVTRCSLFTPRTKQGCGSSCLWPGRGLVDRHQGSSLGRVIKCGPDVGRSRSGEGGGIFEALLRASLMCSKLAVVGRRANAISFPRLGLCL